MRRADRRAFRLAYLAWIFGIFAYFLPAATWNPVSRFNLTRAIVERGTIRVDPYVTSTGDRAKVGDHWYSDKAPGMGVLAVPAYAIMRGVHALRGMRVDYEAGGSEQRPAVRFVPNLAFQQAFYVCSLSTSGVAGTAIALLLFELFRRRTSTRVAFLASSMIVIGSPLLPYSTTLYGHVPAAAFLLGAVECLDGRGRLPQVSLPSRRRLQLAGLCFALAVTCEYLTVFPAALIAVWFLVRVEPAERLRSLLALSLGAAGPLALAALYNTAAFGAPWRTGYSFETNQAFAAGHAQGLLGLGWPRAEALYGITFGPLRGLFHLWPVLAIAAMFAGLHAYRRKDWAIAAGLAALALLFLLNSGYYMWWGGAAVAPRHVLPGVPYLAAGFVLALQGSRRWIAFAVIALFVFGAATSVGFTGMGVEAREHGDLFRDHLLQKLADGKIRTFAGASNLGQKLGLPATPISLVPLLVWIGCGYVYLLHRLRQASAARRFS
ncbi:MAG TPA: hypothetical protein VGK73_33770 [Polyangiaceae bacterium]